MAETVVSMASSMVGGAISMAASAAAAEMSLLMDVQKDIRFIKDELETIQAFLEVAEVTNKKDVLLKVWAKQVRDLSYNIEDCLGEFMVHVKSQSLSRRLMKLKDRHRIAKQIRDLKTRVEEVSIRNTRYNLIKIDGSTTIDKMDSLTEDVRCHSASNIDEAQLVGFSKPKEELIRLLDVNNRDGLAKVICVVGMGGLGKTTLTRKTYESKEDIVKNFTCCSWITVSQSLSKIDTLKSMIIQFLGNESLNKCLDKLKGKRLQVEDLASYLRENLNEKRYFIVLDDLWTIDAWEWMKGIAFPSNNIKGSRIILTTRDVGLAKQITIDDSLIYHHEPLDLVDATNLLLGKSRKTQQDMENHNMTTVVANIVKKCGCLPLAILTIGGMLATKKVTEWESIYKQIPSELESHPTLEAMRRMVILSYNHLPSHLKSCFLYLSIFPEDCEIERRRLVDRWITEGFVRAKAGVSIEDVGICYFNELINRSMIQPSRVNIEGIIKSCRVHDIMHDVMVSIARDENFVYLAGDSVTGVTEANFRHVAYHGSQCQKICMDWSHVRSLTVFGERPMEPSPLLCSPDLRMVRALDLHDAQYEISQKDINNVGLLRHLKHVNVRRGKEYSAFLGERKVSPIYEIPRSIGKLQDLQTLDIGMSYITKLPTEINKLKSLRSLRCGKVQDHKYIEIENPIKCLSYSMCWPLMFIPSIKFDNRELLIADLHMAYSSRWSRSLGVRVPRGIGNLQELQILEVVAIKQTSGKAIKEMGKLTQLRKLHVVIEGASEQKCKLFCASIEKLSSLRSLTVDAVQFIKPISFRVGTLEWLHLISSPPPIMRSLKLEGTLEEMPNWFGKLNHLVKIYLRWSQVKEGKSMEILETLPNLMLLGLDFKAYVGKTLVFTSGAFLNLRKLDIFHLHDLSELRFEEATSPQMEMIQIRSCKLNSGIIGIKHLPKLREISLGYDSKVAKLGVLQGKVDTHPNHPVLRLVEGWSEHDLGGDVVQGSNAAQIELAEEESSLLPEPAPAAGESSRVMVTPPPRTSDSQDNDIGDDADDFCSCISDDEADC